MISTVCRNNPDAYAHFFGATKSVDGYQVIFQPFPSVPLARDNSTSLNLSILDKDNQNVNNIFASLDIIDKNSKRVIYRIPEKFYEFSDISFPHTFTKVGDYGIAFKFKINSDPSLQNKSTSTDFDLSVADPNQIIPTNELLIYYVLPGLAVTLGIAIYLKKKNKI
jgi:hypothetical protein